MCTTSTTCSVADAIAEHLGRLVLSPGAEVLPSEPDYEAESTEPLTLAGELGRLSFPRRQKLCEEMTRR